MAAPKGNKFWEARSRHGRTPIFESPEMLWEAALDYFQWVEDNPLWEDKITSYQGEVTHEPVAKMRAMTEASFCIFADMSRPAWENYCKKEGFLSVCNRIKTLIREQKFSGAAADLLNPNIIARDLGLADRQEHTGAGGGPISVARIERVIVENPKDKDG